MSGLPTINLSSWQSEHTINRCAKCGQWIDVFSECSVCLKMVA